MISSLQRFAHRTAVVTGQSADLSRQACLDSLKSLPMPGLFLLWSCIGAVHAYSPKSILANCAQLLTPGTLFLLSTLSPISLEEQILHDNTSAIQQPRSNLSPCLFVHEIGFRSPLRTKCLAPLLGNNPLILNQVPGTSNSN